MRKLRTLLPMVFLPLILVLSACQQNPAPPSEPTFDPVVFVRTSVQTQPDGSYGIWEYNADESRTRFTSYDSLGRYAYRIDYLYDGQNRLLEEKYQWLNQDGSVLEQYTTYNYSGAEAVITLKTPDSARAACTYTMSDPAHQVKVKNVGQSSGKVTELTIKELDVQGTWLTDQRIVLEP